MNNCKQYLELEVNSGHFIGDPQSAVIGFEDKDGNFHSLDSEQVINYFNLETGLLQLDP